LFAECFRRKLTFIVGTSVTTGQKDCVVWAGIHHKTSPTGGFASFGYPDATYFDRVREEMAARGVTPDQIGNEIQPCNP
jgi:deltex